MKSAKPETNLGAALDAGPMASHLASAGRYLLHLLLLLLMQSLVPLRFLLLEQMASHAKG
jgi:hypothetical protein